MLLGLLLLGVVALLLVGGVLGLALRSGTRADQRAESRTTEPPPPRPDVAKPDVEERRADEPPGFAAAVVVEPGSGDTIVPEPVVVEPEPIVRARLRDRLGKTRVAFSGYLRGLAGRGIDDDVYDDLEEALLLADVGVATTNRLLGAVRESVARTKARDADDVVTALRYEVETLLADDVDRSLRRTEGRPSVWMFVGVNGVGKTTTIGKLAAQHVADGRRVLVAAADTFRAAAAEQLSQWAQLTGAEIVRGDEGADPGAIVFDAMAAATSRGVDLLLVDTAGRLHTKHNLMTELEKLRRIVDRTEGALHEVLLVIDATTGQNGLQQAKLFADAVDVTGIVLTKLDGTSKGGIVLAIQAELGLPVKVVGVGETVGDLIEFDPTEFTAGLFDTGDG